VKHYNVTIYRVEGEEEGEAHNYISLSEVMALLRTSLEDEGDRIEIEVAH
jgi:hypothetical protein